MAIVHSAINRLSAEERALVTLFYMNECSIKEITVITDDTEANVKIKLFRVRKKLGEMLKHTFHNKMSLDHEK